MDPVHSTTTHGRIVGAVVLCILLLLVGSLPTAAAPRVDPGWSALVAGETGPVPTDARAAGFQLIVRPGPDGFPGGAFIGQKVRLLIAIRPLDGDWRGTARIEATAPGARVRVRLDRLPPGLVGEVVVIPRWTDEERTIDITVRAHHAGDVVTRTRTITLYPETDLAGPWAREILDHFLPWIARRFPDLGIGPDTPLYGSIARPRWLIVMRYVFVSRDWEIGLEWHVTREPDDWAHVYLRHRWTELSPSFGAEVTSVLRGDRPHVIAPSTELYR